MKYYNTGRYDEAEKLAISTTDQFPYHQFSWKILNAILIKTTKLSEAVVAGKRAILINPEDAEAHSNLGLTLKMQGNLEAAVKSFEQAINLKKENAEAFNDLGITLKELGRLEEAETSYRKAISYKSNFAEAYNNLSITLKELDRLDEAEASSRQAIVLKPDYANAYNNLGIALKEQDKLKEAEVRYKQAIELKPDYAEAHNNLGNTLKDLGRLDEAEINFRKAITLKPDVAESHNNLSITLKELSRLEEAEVSCKVAIALKNDFAIAHNNLGGIYQELGRLDEAEQSFRKAIKYKPDYAEAHRNIVVMVKFDKFDEHFLQMQELYLNGTCSDEQLCHLSFALAKASEDLGNLGQAFKYYCEGNALRKKFLNYDISQDIKLFNELKTSYPKIKKGVVRSEYYSNKITPIFIVGMPRSGTTLVEQIISSHSQVLGAGELNFIDMFGNSIARGKTEITTNLLLNFRKNYLIKLKSISNDTQMVTDKMPHNFRYIGLIAAAFPEAKIVHVKRNSAAVAWGNYKQFFTSKSLGYCYELADIIKYYELYQNIMEFWEIHLTNRIYNLDYELLTINQEDETRDLINYLGLDWEKNCLSPQDNRRVIATASNVQAREKVYQGSSQQWKKFKPFLNDVLEHLDES